MHNNVVQKFANTPVNIRLVLSDDDPEELFSKYNVNYVPQCIVIKNGKTKTLSGNITPDNIQNLIDSM
jgi:hypothetical protein